LIERSDTNTVVGKTVKCTLYDQIWSILACYHNIKKPF